MRDELGIEVTPERIEELRRHFVFRSDSAARDVGLILNAQQAEIERLRAKVEAVRSILWMAQAYAEGGGSTGPEMREFLAAVSIIGED